MKGDDRIRTGVTAPGTSYTYADRTTQVERALRNADWFVLGRSW